MSRLVFLVVLATCVSAPAGYSPNLRPSTATDEFVYRLASRYGLTPPRGMSSQPLHTGHLLVFLATADSLDSEGLLTAQESYRLETLRKICTGERDLYGWTSAKGAIENHAKLGLLGEIQPSYADSLAARFRGTIRPSIAGAVGRLSYFTEIDVSTEYRSDTMFLPSGYQPYMGIPYNLYGRADSSSVRSSDVFRGGISLDTRFVGFETAVDYFRQGPAVYYPLAFSGSAPPLTYFRTRIPLGGPDYTHAFGLLRSQKDKKKYFYAHRLAIPALNGRLNLGISEAVVTGSTTDEQDSLDPDNAVRSQYRIPRRGWEWVYAIPFVPFAFAEHYAGDRDNAVMSFDLSVAAPACFRWYLEFFLDDMTSPFTIFSDDWGNKWALTAGAQYFGTIAAMDFTATVEYSRVEPWVYTHFGGGSHRYTHFGQCLGSPLGPNSDAFVVAAALGVHPKHTVGLEGRAVRRNELARGGSVRHVWQEDVDSGSKRFLDGPGLSTAGSAGATWQYNPFGLFHVNAALMYDSERGIALDASGGFSF